ncbi:cytochrome P450 [Mesorhizobium sp. SP-1A]|uniref:cytochrome P450 n=1 Tax=Mesorhizobium sp. SP-1A TaxID=3077840 RepID=UPI0028F73443|nr:cytochrome P450 [Mesorhizobium sp. SP-1A]
MFKCSPKYFQGISQAQAALPIGANVPPFDLERMRSSGWTARAVGYLFEHPDWWLSFFRTFWPRARCGRFLLLTRNADVREVLERQAEFETPYGPEMVEFAGGSDFILGMADGAEYRRLKSVVLGAFPPAEVEARVRPIAARRAREIVDAAGDRLNAAWDLFRIVSSTICREYYGMKVDDEGAFADWAIALSTMFFGDPTANRTVRELAIAAARNMQAAIDGSIDAIVAGGALQDRPLDRLVAAMQQERVSRSEIHAIMLGMITGFGPTTLLGGGNCLDVVLSRPEIFAELATAIADRDDKRLDKAIVEAMRFKPIWVSPWRYAREEQKIGAGTRKPYRVKGDTVVWPATRSAMFDKRAVEDPWRFKPDRPSQDSLVFGHGIHKCIGAALARVQTAECFRALFSRPGFRRAAGRQGRLRRLGPYPDRLMVEFDPAGQQSLITVIVPARPGVRKEEVEARLDAVGNPSNGEVRQKLDAVGTIHFTSISIIETGTAADGSARLHLVLEIVGDGSKAAVLRAFVHALGDQTRQMLAEASADPVGADLAAFMDRHAEDVSPDFGSLNGLVFSGTPGHTVDRILREDRLAKTAMRTVEELSARPGSDAAAVLQDVRSRLRRDRSFDWAFIPVANALDDPPKGGWSAVQRTFLAKPVYLTVLAIYACCWALTYYMLFYPTPTWPHFLLRLGTALILSGLGILSTLALIVALLLVWLRRLETASTASMDSISLKRLEELQQREDRGMQNHMTAVSTIKPGIFRRLLLRFVFYIISIAATHIFRPGFLSSIGTIHFARWVCIRDTDTLVFFSNYGGSWESYLEDFITKASKGLTGVWGNTEGFPPPRFLFFYGARDGDRFKRWARTQQIPTRFWYSAYPHLSTTLIRKNALIRQGICSAKLSEARDWISLFSSTERKPSTRLDRIQRLLLPDEPPEEILEQGEIQSVVFGPMGRLAHGRMLAFQIPEKIDMERRKSWLGYIASHVSFGDSAPAHSAMTVLFAPDGLLLLGLDGAAAGDDPLASFPLAFRQGMSNPYRSRILDDVGSSDPSEWLWGSGKNTVDVIVNCYADGPATLEGMVEMLEKASCEAGIPVVHRLDLSVIRPYTTVADGNRPKAREHFGFLDGISQPIIRGAGRGAANAVPPMHLLNPGEFLFGYRDEHGFYPPAPVVPSAADPLGILRAIKTDGSISAVDRPLHDFGRNGSFMVVRQLCQHVDRFNDYCRQAAREVSKLTREPVTPDWVAARIVGRWKDGTSLIRSPDKPAGGTPDNQFSFGAEDPQGLKCPLGAHMRRSNPRASLDTDLDTQIRITKRHRILRVGRTYSADGKDGKTEQGLLFMCVNASIERQYEFIQQTWMSARNFNGLRDEKDPLIGNQTVDEAGDPVGRYAIPRWEGSIALQGMPSFVTTRGGGYFFLPSKSALRYMLSRLR